MGAPAVTDPAGDAPVDPDSPEGLRERLRRRQQVVDDQAEQLRAWRALGADPAAVQASLTGTPPAPLAPAAGDPPVDVEAIRAEARREAEATISAAANARVLEADVRAALVGRVSISPESALALMRDQLGGITIGADGRADRMDVEVAVRALIEREPAIASTAAPRFPAPLGQGPRGGGEPKSLVEQIAEAKAAGNTRLAIALERSKLAQKA